jgi:hypothetical protein
VGQFWTPMVGQFSKPIDIDNDLADELSTKKTPSKEKGLRLIA